MTNLTADGIPLAKGDRLFNYYDLKWGVVAEEPDSEGWFRFVHDDGTTTLLNGERVSTYKPRWAR